MGNETREGRHWEGAETRVCRLCEGELETLEHMWEGCRRWREGEEGWKDICEKILRDEGDEEWWMRVLDTERRE